MIYRTVKKLYPNLFIITLAVFVLAPIYNQSAEAQQLVCPPRAIEQITEGSGGLSEDSSINADGSIVAFESSNDLVGTNPNFQRQVYIADTLTGDITQITFDQNNSSTFPSINGDGSRIAFESRSNINGGNPMFERQIYIFDTTIDTFIQATDDPDEPSGDPSINADGTRIAFESNSNINGGNPENNLEIFVFDTNTLTTIQITNELAGNSINPSISADGNLVAFQSDSGIPGGPVNIFLANISNGTITKITSATGNTTGGPALSADGNFISFESNESLTGQFNDGSPKIFLFDVTAGTLTQITLIPGVSRDSSLNADGTIIAFDSNANFNGENVDGNRDSWLFDTRDGIFTLVTNAGDADSFNPVISADGTRVAFNSRININGGNPTGELQIYVTRCLDPRIARNIPTLSEWGLIAMAGALGIIAVLAIRRTEAAV